MGRMYTWTAGGEVELEDRIGLVCGALECPRVDAIDDRACELERAAPALCAAHPPCVQQPCGGRMLLETLS